MNTTPVGMYTETVRLRILRKWLIGIMVKKNVAIMQHSRFSVRSYFHGLLNEWTNDFKHIVS